MREIDVRDWKAPKTKKHTAAAIPKNNNIKKIKRNFGVRNELLIRAIDSRNSSGFIISCRAEFIFQTTNLQVNKRLDIHKHFRLFSLTHWHNDRSSIRHFFQNKIKKNVDIFFI